MSGFSDTDKAHGRHRLEMAIIYTAELVMGLDKRTTKYRKAREALALLHEIRRSEDEEDNE